VPPCTVISQKSELCTIVKSGRVIMLKMSRGPKVNRMPDFLAKNFDDAQSELVNDKNLLWDGVNIRERG
jgi:beta-lactam-binding protein with PASTA domain